ncbi:hypothetical protein [Acetobacter senegalensis]|uniref:hypothetical protein n=1 Tax=Acetobacter senegalensis TaxID=446692 RepID=UPI00142E1A57|nr:hypothetical protein [Acetobacter senegalensis]MCP1197704.1 hypothetical protein [Acetobacter senegalensis]
MTELAAQNWHLSFIEQVWAAFLSVGPCFMKTEYHQGKRQHYPLPTSSAHQLLPDVRGMGPGGTGRIRDRCSAQYHIISPGCVFAPNTAPALQTQQ